MDRGSEKLMFAILGLTLGVVIGIYFTVKEVRDYCTVEPPAALQATDNG